MKEETANVKVKESENEDESKAVIARVRHLVHHGMKTEMAKADDVLVEMGTVLSGGPSPYLCLAPCFCLVLVLCPYLYRDVYLFVHDHDDGDVTVKDSEANGAFVVRLYPSLSPYHDLSPSCSSNLTYKMAKSTCSYSCSY